VARAEANRHSHPEGKTVAMMVPRPFRSALCLCAFTLAFGLLLAQIPAAALAAAPIAPSTPLAADEGPPAYQPVYRFYNQSSGSHFYTTSEAEKTTVENTLGSVYSLDGIAYGVTSDPKDGQPLHRFYNKTSGTHFYTASEEEKTRVIKDLSDTYSYDGPAYNVSAVPATDSRTVWRFYNKLNGSHFYTASEAERDSVASTLSETYVLEGPAFYLPSRGTITIATFGYSFAGPPDGCAYVADVRNIDVGGFSQDETGLMTSVRERVMAVPAAQEWLAVMRTVWMPTLKAGDEVAIGCSRGHHRSVTLAVIFAEDLRAQGYAVDVLHRDILKSW
jgi:hypothetical protein